MEQQQLKFNDLTREVVEDFISKMSKEEKKKLREYIESHPRDSSSGMFAMVKSYVYNNFFLKGSIKSNYFIIDLYKGTILESIDDNTTLVPTEDTL